MTTLKEFLATASEDDSIALNEARAYNETRGHTLTSDVMTMLLVGNGLYAEFSDLANDTQSPARGIVMAFMDRVRTDSSFNFQPDHPKGQANLGMVDALISIVPSLSTELNQLKSAVISESTETITPFSETTLYDVMITRGNVPVKEVSQMNGWVTINIATDVEKHNPRLLALNERTNEIIRVNNFREVSDAGVYDCQVPKEWINSTLFVDDAYGVI